MSLCFTPSLSLFLGHTAYLLQTFGVKKQTNNLILQILALAHAAVCIPQQTLKQRAIKKITMTQPERAHGEGKGDIQKSKDTARAVASARNAYHMHIVF